MEHGIQTTTIANSCNQALNPEIIKQLKHDEREKKDAEKAPDKLDILNEKMKNSEYLLVRIFYRILYSIWATFIAIVSFFMWMIAAGPG